MIPVFQREATRTPRSNVRWMRLLALLILVFASLAAVTGVILKQTSAGAVGDDWSTYLHDPQRSSTSNDTTISTSNAGQLVKTGRSRPVALLALLLPRLAGPFTPAPG